MLALASSLARPVLVGILILATAPLVNGQGRDPHRSEVRGMLKAVDVSAGSITVLIGAGRESPTVEKVFKLTKNVEVCIGGGFRIGGVLKAAKLAELPTDIMVGLVMTADQKMVDCIHAEEPMVHGILKAVDAKKHTVTIRLAGGREASDEEASYGVPVDAEIAIDDGRGRRFLAQRGQAR